MFMEWMLSTQTFVKRSFNTIVTFVFPVDMFLYMKCLYFSLDHMREQSIVWNFSAIYWILGKITLKASENRVRMSVGCYCCHWYLNTYFPCHILTNMYITKNWLRYKRRENTASSPKGFKLSFTYISKEN